MPTTRKKGRRRRDRPRRRRRDRRAAARAAGLDVVGLEAGARFSVRDFPADEIRERHPQLAGAGEGEQRGADAAANAADPTTPAIAPGRMMNAVGGTSIHWTCQSWRLMPWNFKAAERDDPPVRRLGHPGRLDAHGLAARLRGARAVLRQGRVPARRLGKAGNIRGTIDPRGNVFEGPRRREYPLPPLRRDRVHRVHGGRGEAARLASVPGPGLRFARRSTTACAPASTTASAPGAAATSTRRRSTNLDAIPQAEKTRNLEDRRARRVVEIIVDKRRPRDRRHLRARRQRQHFQPAKVVLLAGYTYENTRLLLLSKSKRLSERPLEQPRTGRQALPRAHARQARTASSRAGG